MKVLVINTVEFKVNGMSNVIMNYFRYTKEKVQYDFVINDSIIDAFRQELECAGCGIFLLKHRNRNPLAYIFRLAGIIRQGNYDIIHIHGNSALMTIDLTACRFSGTKAKKIVHAHNTSCTHMTLHKMLYPLFLKSYDYAVACSRAAGEWLYGKTPYTVLNNGIQEEKFRFRPQLRIDMRQEQGISDNQLVLLHVGLFNEQKNHAFLIKVFQEIVRRDPDAQLRLVGQGPKMEEIKALTEKLGLQKNITFVGVTLTPEAEYHMADVFVMPSLYESFGLVTVEAQCSGLPCVLSDTIPKEVCITENVSYLSLSLSAGEWADKILSFRHAERTDQQSAVIAHNYSISREAQKLVEYYTSILSGKI